LTTLFADVTVTSSLCKYGAVAQLGEHKAGSLGVRGSIPLSSTKFSRGWSSLTDPFSFDYVSFVLVERLLDCEPTLIKHNQGNTAAFKAIGMSDHKRLVLKIVPYKERIPKKGQLSRKKRLAY
jgi:hypothetical protein